MLRLGIFIVVAALSAAAAPAFARFGPAICNCTPAEPRQRIEMAHKIYIATVRDIVEQTAMLEPGRDDPPVVVTLDVSEAFKDAAPRTTEYVHDSLTRVTCTGHAFEKDQEYLVFAYKRLAAKYEHWSLYDFKTGTYGVGSLCGGTKRLNDPAAKADIALLRQLKQSGDPALVPQAKPEL